MTGRATRWARRGGIAAVVALVAGVAIAAAPAGVHPDVAGAQSRPPVDAPELARLGDHPVGVARQTFVQRAQLDPLSPGAQPATVDRTLPVLIWYPAARGGRGTVYHAAMTGEDGRDVPFDLPGIAADDAAPAAGHFPLVILAHGYGNAPEALAWLGENLASKGYVVVAPAFRDPAISIRTAAARAGPITRRPLDIAFVAREAQRRARAGTGPLSAADAARTALIGYSMGGYGVLTVAGAPLNPALGPATRGILTPYAAGGARIGALAVPDLKAVVSMSPASRFGDAAAWAAPGVDGIATPTLYIVGDHDKTVGYQAVRDLFDAQRRAPRYLLTFKEAGHSIALAGAPASMRDSFWNLDWFEDAVWRKDRLLPIEAHFITAFLDRYVKGEAARARYLDGLVVDADQGAWPGAPVGRVAAYSPGTPPVTTWPGFQPSRATGMRFEAKPAS